MFRYILAVVAVDVATSPTFASLSPTTSPTAYPTPTCTGDGEGDVVVNETHVIMDQCGLTEIPSVVYQRKSTLTYLSLDSNDI